MPVYNGLLGTQQNLIGQGPILKMEVLIPAVLENRMLANGETPPAPYPGIALFDTGATCTSIDKSVVLALGLSAVGQRRSGSAQGQHTINIFAARIRFPGTSIDFTSIEMGELDLSSQVLTIPGQSPTQLIVLIGRDFLQHGVFAYNGFTGSFSFGF